MKPTGNAPARPRFTIDESLATVLQLHTQRKAATYIGVNSRTFERWLSGEIKPSKASEEKIRHAAANIRRQLKAKAKRDDYIAINTRVPVYGQRRLLKQFNARGKHTGKYYYSDWVNYRVDKLNFAQTLAVLVEIQKIGAIIQFIYYDLWGITSDGERYGLPIDVTGKPIKTELTGSTHFLLAGQSQRDLANLLRKFMHGEYPKGRSNLVTIASLH